MDNEDAYLDALDGKTNSPPKLIKSKSKKCIIEIADEGNTPIEIIKEVKNNDYNKKIKDGLREGLRSDTKRENNR